MSARLVYIDGHFIPEQDARLSLHDAGFVWAHTVTDRVRTYDRRFFRLPDHLARFRRSCEFCRVPQPIADSELTQLSQCLLQHNAALANADDEFVLIMFATPGVHSPNLGLMLDPLDYRRYQPLIERGARLITPSIRQMPAESVSPQAKMRSRMHWWIAEREVHEIDPEASALLLDSSGIVTETSIANFAIVQNGTILTSPRGSVLDGISLRVVQELSESLGLGLQEREISLDDCFAADEALLTGTSFGICGVSSLNARPIPWPGETLRRLERAWSKLAGIDIWHQFVRRG